MSHKINTLLKPLADDFQVKLNTISNKFSADAFELLNEERSLDISEKGITYFNFIWFNTIQYVASILAAMPIEIKDKENKFAIPYEELLQVFVTGVKDILEKNPRSLN